MNDRILSLVEITSCDNWDNERGRAIPKDQWQLALDWKLKIFQKFPELKEPFISPCGDGSIHLNYDLFNLEIYSSSDIVINVQKNILILDKYLYDLYDLKDKSSFHNWQEEKLFNVIDFLIKRNFHVST